jgi:hypothetical protein
MKFKILAVFILFSYLSQAQRLIMDVLDPSGANPNLQSGVSNNNIYGSMFLTNWCVGYVYYGTKKEEKKLRYNAYKDIVHVMDAQGQELVIEKGQIEAFSVVDNNKEYKFRWITDIPKISFGYLQIIYEGKVKVYYRHSRKIRQNISDTEGYAGNDKEDKFENDDAYVIELPNKVKHLTKARKKDILAIFADKKKELDEFIKSKKLDTQNLKDLIEVIEKYENMLAE